MNDLITGSVPHFRRTADRKIIAALSRLAKAEAVMLLCSSFVKIEVQK